MSALDDRKKAWESKFAHDGELRFKATARRNKLLGLWAADKLNLVDDEADAYAREVIKSDFEEVGDEDVIRKVTKDFAAKGVGVSEQEIRAKLIDFMGIAVQQIEKDA